MFNHFKSPERSWVYNIMKTKEIIAQGHCGIDVTLNVMDQYAITHVANRLEEYFQKEEAYADYIKLRNRERPWGSENKEKALAWDNEHPEPERVQLDLKDEVQTILKFLKKLTLNSESMPTVFD